MDWSCTSVGESVDFGYQSYGLNRSSEALNRVVTRVLIVACEEAGGEGRMQSALDS